MNCNAESMVRARAGWPAPIFLAAAAALTVLAGWAHFPGHVSMDSSMQLYEASLGKSITWNPPYMTAILRWLGTGPAAAGRMMVLNSALTYLALATAAAAAISTRGAERSTRVTAVRIAAVLLILANPILFLYVGIVWKDVLFSTLMTSGAAAGVFACVSRGRTSVLSALMSAVLLAIGMKVRQQGVFMAPVLLAVPVFALTMGHGLKRAHAVARGGALLACFLLTSAAMSQLVARTIHTDPSLGSQVGFRGLMQYDVTGMTALSGTPSSEFPLPMTDELRSEIRRVYSPDRGDFMWYSPTVAQWLSLPGYDGIRKHWWTLVNSEPGSYLRHRMAVFRAILNVDGVKACLPVHVGIEGNQDYLREIGFVPGVDRHDQSLFHLSQAIIRWPLYRHWVYVLALVVATALVLVTPMQQRLKWASIAIALATVLLYGSYLPTSIACDFRYLFPAVCMVSMLWIILVAGARGRPSLAWRRARAKPERAA